MRLLCPNVKEGMAGQPTITNDSGAMHELDLKGLKCPLPVLRTQKELKALPANSRIVVLTTDPMASIDIAHFCAEHGHKLIEASPLDATTMQFTIQKSDH